MPGGDSEGVFVAMGTLGDILPPLRIATLVARLEPSLQVRFVTHERFLGLVQPPLVAARLPFDPVSILSSRAGRWMIGGGFLGLKRVVGTYRVVRPRLHAVLAEVRRVGAGARFVAHAGLPFGTHDVLEQLGVPHARIYLQPHWPTGDHKSLYLSVGGNWGAPLNALSHKAVEKSTALLFGRHYSAALRDLEVDVCSRLVDPSFSEGTKAIFAVGHAFAHGEMRRRPNAVVTGFVQPHSQHPPLEPRLGATLSALPAPRVLATFGSMSGPRIAKTTAHLVAMAQAGEISLALQAGWQNLPASLSRRIVTVPPLDHRELMPCFDVIVHHGGAGTVAAALRAGRPAVVIPQWFDQFYWGQSCEQLGVGVTLPRARITAAALTDAIGTCLATKSAMASRIGPSISLEDGTERAALEILKIGGST